jgi:hypothetical protein
MIIAMPVSDLGDVAAGIAHANRPLITFQVHGKGFYHHRRLPISRKAAPSAKLSHQPNRPQPCQAHRAERVDGDHFHL